MHSVGKDWRPNAHGARGTTRMTNQQGYARHNAASGDRMRRPWGGHSTPVRALGSVGCQVLAHACCRVRATASCPLPTFLLLCSCTCWLSGLPSFTALHLVLTGYMMRSLIRSHSFLIAPHQFTFVSKHSTAVPHTPSWNSGHIFLAHLAPFLRLPLELI